MMPLVGSAAQARELVSWTRYPPLGHRGAAFGIAHDGYTGGTPREKIDAAHSRTLVIAMIETPEGVANVDAIAAVPGVDVLFLGHMDLTNFMGIPGEFEHPAFEAAVRAIGQAAQRHGKLAATLALGKQIPVALVRFLGRAKASVLPHRPEAAPVHCRLDAAGERVFAGESELFIRVPAVQVVSGVHSVDRHLPGRFKRFGAFRRALDGLGVGPLEPLALRSDWHLCGDSSRQTGSAGIGARYPGV